jgi:hypothetical protein
MDLRAVVSTLSVPGILRGDNDCDVSIAHHFLNVMAWRSNRVWLELWSGMPIICCNHFDSASRMTVLTHESERNSMINSDCPFASSLVETRDLPSFVAQADAAWN